VAVYPNNNKARKMLDWNTKFGLEDIMGTAWKWELEMAKAQ